LWRRSPAQRPAHAGLDGFERGAQGERRVFGHDRERREIAFLAVSRDLFLGQRFGHRLGSAGTAGFISCGGAAAPLKALLLCETTRRPARSTMTLRRRAEGLGRRCLRIGIAPSAQAATA
jgi:hypothetical protein